MFKLFLAASVAAMAVTSPAAAEKGGKGGGGHGGGAKAERGGGGHAAKVDRQGGGQKFERRSHGGGEFRAQRQDRGKEFRAERRGGGRDMRMERRDGGHRMASKNERRTAERFDRRAYAQQRHSNVERHARRDTFEQRADRVVRPAQVRVASRDWDDLDRWDNVRARAYGCPPGLAAKANGCLPPGQAKKLIGSVLPAAYASAYLPDRLRSYYADDDDYFYRYGDGYVYRVNRGSNLVSALLPLFGGSYALGQQFPLSNPAYAVPGYYQSFYPDTPYSAYRYDDGYLYQVDPITGLVEDVVPTLGYGYGVGQMLPAGYSAYNVPYQYRDMYYDTDDYYYRYAPGAIYQVDRDSSLITAVASLLTGAPLGVGQALPMGYDTYNVPYAYRDRYYDTNDAWCRYADGNIYQVDPTTRLITAVIDAIV